MARRTKSSESKEQGMQVNQYDLAVVMNEMQRIAKGELPMTRHVYLSSEQDDQLTVMVNDLEVALIATLQAKGNLRLPTCLPADTLNKMVKGVKKGSNETVEIVVHGGMKCDVHVDGMTTTLQPGLPAEDFLNEVGGLGLINKYPIADLANMRDMLKHVLRSVSIDETRYNFNHVLLNFDPDELVAVSTDGHRLHLAPLTSLQTPLPKCSGSKDVLTDKHMLATAVRVIAKEKNGSASFEFDKDNVSFRMLGDRINWDIVSKRMTEDFPEYKHVVPEDHQQKNVVTVLHADLEKVAKRMLNISDSGQDGSLVGLDEKGLTISIREPQASTMVAVQQSHRQAKKQDDRAIGVNLKYVVDALLAKREKEILFSFADSLSPIVIELGGGFKSVIMCLRM